MLDLKAATDLTGAHFAVVRSYLRTVDRVYGLILNFAKPTLEVKRGRARPEP